MSYYRDVSWNSHHGPAIPLQTMLLTLEDSIGKAEREMDELILQLKTKQYNRAARYVSRAKSQLFSYVRLWLRYGLVSPRVSSIIERIMREIGRRLKRMAFGWSEDGAAKITRIIIKRIASAHEWEQYWQQRLRITGSVVVMYQSTITLPEQRTLGHYLKF